MQSSSQQFKRLNISAENIQKFRNLLILIMADQRTEGAPETLESFETFVVNSMKYMLSKIHKPYTDDDIVGAFLISVKSLMEGTGFNYNLDYIPELAGSRKKLNEIEMKFLVKINFDIPSPNIIQQQKQLQQIQQQIQSQQRFQQLTIPQLQALQAQLQTISFQNLQEQKTQLNTQITIRITLLQHWEQQLQQIQQIQQQVQFQQLTIQQLQALQAQLQTISFQNLQEQKTQLNTQITIRITLLQQREQQLQQIQQIQQIQQQLQFQQLTIQQLQALQAQLQTISFQNLQGQKTQLNAQISPRITFLQIQNGKDLLAKTKQPLDTKDLNKIESWCKNYLKILPVTVCHKEVELLQQAITNYKKFVIKDSNKLNTRAGRAITYVLFTEGRKHEAVNFLNSQLIRTFDSFNLFLENDQCESTVLSKLSL